ncbi:uncharacterized protein CC84DRAFT_862203 [Paraphaeosphaeria sporulosa]|uniref:Metallothionein n=1 Tax=Paraphaeosphaeria sporulosa TaxID=1460663 RepID=A0A177CA58_9PLEO|nr:uncharacterized protein CC84DRAFT_862203 [Paraphaeosphaeria sporulosa]OAG03647.1 hypothetical protein CC84DRAFT_862203 [Paraphaeosphaeria sporulosa]
MTRRASEPVKSFTGRSARRERATASLSVLRHLCGPSRALDRPHKQRREAYIRGQLCGEIPPPHNTQRSKSSSTYFRLSKSKPHITFTMGNCGCASSGTCNCGSSCGCDSCPHK